MAALCYVSFTFLQIKIPVPGGDATSIHIGNAFCVLAALLIGGVYGGLSGAIGMGIADLMDPVYITGAPKTFVLKFCIGLITGLVAHKIAKINESTDKKYVFKWSVIASVAGLAFNVVADPIVGYFYKQYILGQPQELAQALAKMSAVATLFNAVVSVILVAVIYNAVRPVLIKSHLLTITGKKKEHGCLIRKRIGIAETAIVHERCAEDLADVIVGKAVQLDQARTGEQRRIHLEERILRRCTDEHHDAILHRMEQRVLLGAIEAVDLVDEQDGAQAAMDQTLVGFRDDLAQIRHRAADGRDFHERCVCGVRNHASERGLAGTCGPIEDDGRERVVLDRRPKPGAFADRLLLSDQLVERARTHTHGKRRVSKARFIFHLGKERIHSSPFRVHSSASLR